MKQQRPRLPKLTRWLKAVFSLVLIAFLLLVVNFFFSAESTNPHSQSLLESQGQLPGLQENNPTPSFSSVFLPSIVQSQSIDSIEEWDLALIREGELWLSSQRIVQAITSGAGSAGSDELMLAQVTTLPGTIVDHVSFSPDGQWILFHNNNNIWVGNITTSKVSKLTDQGEVLETGWVVDAHSAIWSPDSSMIAYLVEVYHIGESDAPAPSTSTGLWVVDLNHGKSQYLLESVMHLTN